MIMNDKSKVKEKSGIAYFFIYAKEGIKKLVKHPIFVVIIIVILSVEIWYTRRLQMWIAESVSSFENIERKLWFLAAIELMIFINSMALFLVGRPIEANHSEVRFIRAGFINSVGEAPYLVKTNHDSNNPKIKIYTFDSNAVPISEWNDKKEYIESGLDITIISISHSKGKRYIEMRFVDAKADLPKFIRWDKSLLSQEDFSLVAGIGPDSLPLTINLNKIPMVLIGGATGSGKSVLLKLLLMQAINKDAEVIISDFKGGVAFHMFGMRPARCVLMRIICCRYYWILLMS